MKTTRILTGCALAMMLAVPAFAETSFHVQLNLGNAPPPPFVHLSYRPHTVWMPEYQVAVVSDPRFDDDCFEVGGFWYVYDNDYWYRSRSWRGPFVVVEDRYVPTTLARIPAHRWHHARWEGPYMRDANFDRDHHDNGYRDHGRRHGRDDDRGRGHDKGRGHGRDKGRGDD